VLSELSTFEHFLLPRYDQGWRPFFWMKNVKKKTLKEDTRNNELTEVGKFACRWRSRRCNEDFRNITSFLKLGK
jgi:hypothetical protein